MTQATLAKPEAKTAPPPKLLSSFKASRRVSNPLVYVTTPDPAATIAQLLKATFTKLETTPLLMWDAARGLQALNDPNTEEPSEATTKAVSQINLEATVNPVACLKLISPLPEKSIVFFLNLHRFFEDARVTQSLWNLRDQFKANRRTVVMLGPPVTLPEEIRDATYALDEPLPNAEQLAQIITETYGAGHFDTKTVDGETVIVPHNPSASVLTRCVDAVAGLAAYPTETAVAMTLDDSDDGINVADLWDRKRHMIERTPGLSVWRGNERFSDVRGCANVLDFMQQICNGNRPPRGIVWCDEMEKGLAGIHGDNTGASQDILGELLSFMADHESTGVLAVGHAGTGKSLVAKATGNNAGIPTIKMDFGGMKASKLGETEARVRNCLKVIEAVTQGAALFIATVNKLAELPVELRSRFSLGTFFWDLPTEPERVDLWEMYTKKFKRKGPIPESTNWTGREIMNCCSLSDRLNCTLENAAKYIVPIFKSSPDAILSLRNQANGKFISASKPGFYEYVDPTKVKVPTGRQISTSTIAEA